MPHTKDMLSTILREFRIIFRYLRRRLFPTSGGRSFPVEPSESDETAPVREEAPIREPEAAAETPKPPEPQADDDSSRTPVPDASEPKPQAVAEKLMSTFGAKLNAREERKRQAISQISRRNRNGDNDDNRQLTFDFDASSETKAPSQETQTAPTPTIYDSPDVDYHLPSPALFRTSPPAEHVDEDEIREVGKRLQDCIDNFNVDAEVFGAVRGPRITLHKIDVAQGVRIGSLLGFERDIAMALSAQSIRILAPVPGHDYVGIEIPNKTADSVLLGDIINGPSWTNGHAQLPLVLGKDIEGTDVILDLAKAPHLIVAGATGSGKSVCLNTAIVSLIARYSPRDLRLLLVDPKQVEMNMYNTLPHLITPVINDVSNVVLALKWLVYEMGNRYRILKLAGVRNLEDFNRRTLPPEPVLDENGQPIPERMPFIVLIIDELADIMLTNRQDVETSLARLAQMSRAVGIHTIIATQRPSVDVLTGVIKANFPTRIAFKTSSQIDSRTIIDGKGAEALLGKGDMLFKPPTAAGMQRIQGAMITDDEIREIVDFCAAQQEAPTSFDIINAAAQQGASEEASSDAGDIDVDGLSDDESLIRAATEIIVREQKASISYIQRRLKIGYNKAASIMEILEQRGVVGPQIGSMKREILITELEE